MDANFEDIISRYIGQQFEGEVWPVAMWSGRDISALIRLLDAELQRRYYDVTEINEWPKD